MVRRRHSLSVCATSDFKVIALPEILSDVSAICASLSRHSATTRAGRSQSGSPFKDIYRLQLDKAFRESAESAIPCSDVGALPAAPELDKEPGLPVEGHAAQEA